MKIWIWWLDGLIPLLWWCTVYSTLSIFRFPFISIFLPVFIKDQYEVSNEKKDLFSLSTVSSLLNFIPSPLFALSWIKHYHINDVIHKAHAELYFFVSRRSSYFDSACIALFMMVVGFAHAPCGWFCLNYKLLVKYEVTNMIYHM